MMTSERGFSLVELLVSLTVLLVVMSGVAAMLFDQRINRKEQMRTMIQADARNCLSMIVQQLRSAGWDPTLAGLPIVVLDPDTSDDVSQIEIFADHDGDGTTDQEGEQVLIRHIDDRIEWRRSAGGTFETLAVNISNDADLDGTIEPMFVPVPATNPQRIRVQITARSSSVDPVTREFMVYTVSSDVLLRKTL